MREFPFELALCARREGEFAGVISRQLGASVHGTRIVDVLEVEPGPAFDERVAITPTSIPVAAIEARVGAGEARYWRDCFDGSSDRGGGLDTNRDSSITHDREGALDSGSARDLDPERARAVVERAVEIGFFERERRGGRTHVRQSTRYPDWFSTLRGVENKPDLGRPGDLERQLRADVSLALLDEVVLATASYVTRAHLNRIPEAVGVWRFDPETGEREVVREPATLPVGGVGIEILDERPGRTEIRPVTPAEKARIRVRLAERAYGKGWRVRSFPACAQCEAGVGRETGEACETDTKRETDTEYETDEDCETSEGFGSDVLPHCGWKDRLVNPNTECGQSCPGYEHTETPAATAADVEAARARRTRWNLNPAGRVRRQVGLDRFGD